MYTKTPGGPHYFFNVSQIEFYEISHETKHVSACVRQEISITVNQENVDRIVVCRYILI